MSALAVLPPLPATAVQGLTARELEVRDAVRAVVREHVAPAAGEVDATSAFPDAGWQALAAAGLGGLLLPAQLGGSGDSTLAYALAMEELAAACGSTSTVFMTQLHAAYPILLAGDQAQRRRWIPPLCDGRAYGALALTEPESGSDAASLRTRARRDGDSYVLDGAKTFITTGDRADTLVVFATVPDGGDCPGGITAFVVERGMEGFGAGAPMHKMGMRGSSTSELHFDGCRVPAEHRLGAEGEGHALLLRAVVKSRVSAAAQGVGLARGAFEYALAWTAERGLLRGREHQQAQFALADIQVDIAAARALLHATARVVDQAEGDLVAEVSAAKLWCTDLALRASLAAVALLGPDGDRVELGVERYVRDAKVTQIYDGTNQIQRILIARQLRGQVGA